MSCQCIVPNSPKTLLAIHCKSLHWATLVDGFNQVTSAFLPKYRVPCQCGRKVIRCFTCGDGGRSQPASWVGRIYLVIAGHRACLPSSVPIFHIFHIYINIFNHLKVIIILQTVSPANWPSCHVAGLILLQIVDDEHFAPCRIGLHAQHLHQLLKQHGEPHQTTSAKIYKGL